MSNVKYILDVKYVYAKDWPDVKNPGILEVPKNKKVDELPLKHFKELVEKKGFEAITRALMNLHRWNKNDNSELAEWADKTQQKLHNWVMRKRKEDPNFALDK
jgi:hypothetical protein